MHDLHRDVKAAFDEQQAQLRDVRGLADQMLRQATVTQDRRSSQLWPSLAGVALVLVAAGAVLTSILVRQSVPVTVRRPAPRPTPSVSAPPSVAPKALAQPLQVPATVPVVLFHDPANFDQIDGITWDGAAKGRVGINAVPGNGISPNFAGSLYATTQDIRDRSGAVVASLPQPTKGFPGTWTDDGIHYCSMASKSPFGQPGGEPATLQVAAVGKPARNVRQVGTAYEQASIGVAACSLDGDRAVVVQSGGQGMGTSQFWVVQLSTGRILWSRSYTQDGVTVIDIRASRDGQYIAENRYRCCQGSQPGPNSTTVYGPTGSVLARLAQRIEAFSWDGAVAVQMPDLSGPVSLVRWRDGTVIWTGPNGQGYFDSAPEPGGSRLRVSLSDPAIPQTSGFPAVNVYVVSSDGQAVKLLNDVSG